MKKLLMILTIIGLVIFQTGNILASVVKTSEEIPVKASTLEPEKESENIINDNITSTTEDITVEIGQLVSGNVTNVSGDIIVKGVVNGNVTTAGGDILIKGSAKINGNVSSATGDIDIEKPAVVQGNLTTGTGDITKEPGADVSGNITKGLEFSHINENNLNHNLNRGFEAIYKPSPGELLINSITTFLGIAAVVALLISIFPGHLDKMVSAFNLETGRIILVGFLGWLLFPFAMLVSILTIIGPLILGLIAALAIFVGVAIVAWLIGEKVQHNTKIIKSDNKFLSTLMGLLIIGLISLLPIAKVFIWAVCAIIGMGVILVTKFGTGRPWFPPKNVVVLSEGDKGGKHYEENKN
jgi:hypothetical protein